MLSIFKSKHRKIWAKAFQFKGSTSLQSIRETESVIRLYNELQTKLVSYENIQKIAYNLAEQDGFVQPQECYWAHAEQQGTKLVLDMDIHVIKNY